jgi:hypothetical protein
MFPPAFGIAWGDQVYSHIEEDRLMQLLQPGGPHLTEEELEHIADCGDCGQRVFDRLFPQSRRVQSSIESDQPE